MAKTKSRADDLGKNERPTAAGWVKLTWDDMESWAGSRSVTRGRAYQRGGRVKDLKVSRDGALLATVVGSARYATTVALRPGGRRPSLESDCTCPVGRSCKHAVAIVAEYLQAVANGRDLPVAAEDDPRWTELEEGAESVGDWNQDDDDDSWNDDDDDDDDAEEYPVKTPRRSQRPARRGGDPTHWDGKIEQHLRAKSQSELADLVWSLTRRFPEVYQEFRERLAIQEGDVARLLAEARGEIRRVTSEPAWRGRRSNEGHIPDYSRIQRRFERLLELGHADEVVSLGREFIRLGMEQVGESHDEGETATSFSECLPVVLQALARSSLSAPERLLFAIDAELTDDYDTLGEATDTVLNASSTPEDWSKVADILTGRLKTAAGENDFPRNYQRDRITNWIARALEEAGRDVELQMLYESEARTNGSYERLVHHLLEARRFDDAERWAREGIAATRAKLPGIAAQLAASLREVARKRKQWDVVAAHAAWEFFEHPSISTFDELMKAAKKAGAEAPVRAAALGFLETGIGPFQVISPTRQAVAPPRARAPSPAKKRSAGTPRAASALEPAAAEPVRLGIDAAWPLPTPDYLIPLLTPSGRYDAGHPHLGVLLDMALAAKQPDEVLRWYDKMDAGQQRPGSYRDGSSYRDRVAQAVAASHPERTIEIFLAALNAQLPHPEFHAYEAATGYLKKLRPIYEALARSGEWDALLASIREKHRNRPNFMELLDRLDGRTIIHAAKNKSK